MAEKSAEGLPASDDNRPEALEEESALNPLRSNEPGEKPDEGKKFTQYLATLFVSLGAMVAGTILAWTSPTLPELQSANSTLPVTQEEGSWVGSLAAVGAIVGALPAGFFAERLGRRLVISALSVPLLVSWVIITFAKTVGTLYAARLIAGVGTGAICVVVPMYVCEIAESSVRGALGSFFQVLLTLGILYVYIIGAVANYMWLGILCSVIPVLLFLTTLRIPESPTYLMKKYRPDDAKTALQFFRGKKYDVGKELEELEKNISESSQQKASIKDLVSTKGTRKALVISLGLMLFQQLSGINAVIFYTVDIFKAAGSTLAPQISAIIVGVVQVIVSYAASVIVDRSGRRILLLISGSVMALCHAILGVYFYLKNKGDDVSGIGWLPLVCVTLFIVAFCLGFGPLPWMMMGELFANNVKGTASSLAVCVNWTSVFLVTYTFGKLVDGLGEHGTFWLFAVICVVATLFVFYLVLETKGKSLLEIQRILDGHERNEIA